MSIVKKIYFGLSPLPALLALLVIVLKEHALDKTGVALLAYIGVFSGILVGVGIILLIFFFLKKEAIKNLIFAILIASLVSIGWLGFLVFRSDFPDFFLQIN